MALTKCEECKKEVSTKAEACPHCGARLKEKSGCLSYIFVGTFLFFVLFLALFSNDTEKIPKTTKQTTTPQITNNEIQFLLRSIDYRAVVRSTGNPCTIVTRKSWTGIEEESGKKFVSVACGNGSEYMVTLPANVQDRTSVMECSLLEAVMSASGDGFRCFDKLDDTP
jgi:hypothetical protein